MFREAGASMTPAEEVKCLKGLLSRLDSPRKSALSSNKLMVGLWLVLVVLFSALFKFASIYQAYPALLVFISVVIGGAMFWVFLRRASSRSWPVISQHFSRDSIQARLRELET
jgi:hypothetical protein